eukprot:6185132-Pleurochrysis_carterae.AAC.3
MSLLPVNRSSEKTLAAVCDSIVSRQWRATHAIRPQVASSPLGLYLYTLPAFCKANLLCRFLVYMSVDDVVIGTVRVHGCETAFRASVLVRECRCLR